MCPTDITRRWCAGEGKQWGERHVRRLRKYDGCRWCLLISRLHLRHLTDNMLKYLSVFENVRVDDISCILYFSSFQMEFSIINMKCAFLSKICFLCCTSQYPRNYSRTFTTSMKSSYNNKSVTRNNFSY